MIAITARQKVKTALASLGVPIKFRGETLPASGSHIIVDLILDSPLDTLDREEGGQNVTLQIGFWALGPLSNASALFDAAHPLLIAEGFYRTGTRFLTEDNWVGVSADYTYMED